MNPLNLIKSQHSHTQLFLTNRHTQADRATTLFACYFDIQIPPWLSLCLTDLKGEPRTMRKI